MMAGGTEQRSLPIFTADAFASAPFTGNPAGVCPIPSAEEDIPDDLKSRIAMEMNLAETSFVHPAKSGETFQNASEFNLRWFTPTNEVKLCGHATMAAATVIFRALGNQGSELRFNTLSGQLVAKKDGQLITLDLPLNPCNANVPSNLAGLIQEVLGAMPVQETLYSPGTTKLLLRLKDGTSRAALEGLTPNISKFMDCHNTGEVKGVIVTVKASSGEVNEDGTPYDFFSRYFAPWNGIAEDSVTGAAHTVLADYWSRTLGKQELFARQCSKRGGDVRIRLLGNNRVELAGKAALVIQGKINV